MTATDTIRDVVAETVACDPSSIRVKHLSATTAKVQTPGESVFCKFARGDNINTLAAELDGLNHLTQSSTFNVPEASLVKDARSAFGVLVLEWLDLQAPSSSDWQQAGQLLAEMHQCSTDQYGHTIDNYIGQTPQKNSRKDSWPEFFRSQRLEPQRQLCVQNGRWQQRWTLPFDSILKRLEELLPAKPVASLLHGDFWRGNCGATRDGLWTFDPSIYYGHSEVDIAMSELFGGFGRSFYESYRESNPAPPEYSDLKAVYNLYHLINHVNMFGLSYAAQVDATLNRLTWNY